MVNNIMDLMIGLCWVCLMWVMLVLYKIKLLFIIFMECGFRLSGLLCSGIKSIR